MVSTKNKAVKILSTFRIIKTFLKHYISILEIFLKDHMTLKTGEVAAESSALHQSINYF